MSTRLQLVYCHAGGHYYWRPWSLTPAPSPCRHARTDFARQRGL